MLSFVLLIKRSVCLNNYVKRNDVSMFLCFYVCSANLDISVASLTAKILSTLSGNCSRNNVLSIASMHCPPAKFRSFYRKFEGFWSARSFPCNSFPNSNSLVSENYPIILCFRVSYLFSVGSVTIISETKGNTAWSIWRMTYLYCLVLNYPG